MEVVRSERRGGHGQGKGGTRVLSQRDNSVSKLKLYFITKLSSC